MTARLDFSSLAPDGVAPLRQLERYLRHTKLERHTIELVRLRASQINGCAYCIDMHTKDARATGETEQRLYALSAWRETPFYSDRERAALEWTEAVTRLGPDGIPDDLYDRVHASFTDRDLVDLTLVVVAINSWNRLAIPFRSVPGSYERPAAWASETA